MPSTFFFSNSPYTITSTNTVINPATYNNRSLTLTGVALGNDVTGFADRAFDSCTGLYTITIPNSVKSMGNNAFSYCYNLTGVNFEPTSTVDRIGNVGFFYCLKLKKISIPDSVSSIGSQFFDYCGNLTDATIGTGLTGFGGPGAIGLGSSFDHCVSLTGLSVASANPKYSTEDNVLFNKNKTTLWFCPMGRTGSYTIPSGVTTVEFQSFFYCSGLTSISIPSGVTYIGVQSFFNCTSLTGIFVDPNSRTYTSESGVLFDNPNKTILIQYPPTRTGIYNIPSGVTTIEREAFYKSNLTAVSIPNTLITMGFQCFGYSNLTGVTFNPTSRLASISTYAFNNSQKLQSIIFPNSINTVGDSSFYGCTGLASVILSPNTQNILYAAFQSCASLTSIILPTSLQTLGDQAFNSCSGLNSVAIPNGVAFIGTSLFGRCTNLNTVYIPKTLSNIGSSTFNNCINLNRVIFLGNAPTLGSNTFFNTPADLKIYRYSSKSGWSNTFDGKTVLLIDSPIHQGLQTFGFLPNLSSGKVSIKKINFGGGKINIQRKSKYELILTISPTNEIYKIYTDDIDPMGLTKRTSLNEYNIEIIKEDNTWFLNFRNINDGRYCNTFATSDNSPEDFREVDWDTYYYNAGYGCPNLNYTRLDITINERY